MKYVVAHYLDGRGDQLICPASHLEDPKQRNVVLFEMEDATLTYFDGPEITEGMSQEEVDKDFAEMKRLGEIAAYDAVRANQLHSKVHIKIDKNEWIPDVDKYQIAEDCFHIWYKLNSIEFHYNKFVVIAEDQGGWPFPAFTYDVGELHSPHMLAGLKGALKAMRAKQPFMATENLKRVLEAMRRIDDDAHDDRDMGIVLETLDDALGVLVVGHVSPYLSSAEQAEK